jgi:predicted transcriptional regulator of viral defense system
METSSTGAPSNVTVRRNSDPPSTKAWYGGVSRLQPGLFVLVPPELGRATEFAGNPYMTARQLAAGAEYFISHVSAMELHRMVTQPQFVIFTSTTKRLRNRTIHSGLPTMRP